jgi:predicted nucleotidyltransferase
MADRSKDWLAPAQRDLNHDRSSDSVKTFFADKARVMRELRAWAANLKATHPDVEKIGLFGSYATDTYGPRSDADLLIVLRASDKPFRDRIPDFLPAGLSVPCDVFPYTTGEIENLQRDESPWIRHILHEVLWL